MSHRVVDHVPIGKYIYLLRHDGRGPLCIIRLYWYPTTNCDMVMQAYIVRTSVRFTFRLLCFYTGRIT